MPLVALRLQSALHRQSPTRRPRRRRLLAPARAGSSRFPARPLPPPERRYFHPQKPSQQSCQTRALAPSAPFFLTSPALLASICPALLALPQVSLLWRS